MAFGAAWLLALGLLTAGAMPAGADAPATNTQIAGGPAAPTTSGIQGDPRLRCPPTCVGGSGSGAAAPGADYGENENLATIILVLICLVGVCYGLVKLVQQRRSRGAKVFRLRERTPGRLPEGEA